MAKILTDKELGLIIDQAINGDAIDCGDAYLHFLEDLGVLISDHFGGEFRGACYEDIPDDNGKELGYVATFRLNENVPADGGVFKACDTDVVWKNGEEDPR